jgi:hypothetical protein
MGRRERAEARLERRRDWAESRDRKAAAGFAAADRIASGIPLGQPILVGHHSEGRHRRDIARIDSGMRAGVESSKMAAEHRSKAAGIEAQLESTIFSDDPDAIEALEARIAELEAKRAERVAQNNGARKAGREATWPAYSLSNLSGNIRRLRERVKFVTARTAQLGKAHAAGGILVELIGPGHWDNTIHARVTFEEFPGRKTVEELKAAGFHWSDPSWWGKADNLPARFAGATEEAK